MHLAVLSRDLWVAVKVDVPASARPGPVEEDRMNDNDENELTSEQVEARLAELSVDKEHPHWEQLLDLDNASKLLREGIVSAVAVIREGNGHPADEVIAVKELCALSEALSLVENVRDQLDSRMLCE